MLPRMTQCTIRKLEFVILFLRVLSTDSLPISTKTNVGKKMVSALNDFGNRLCKRESVECNALKAWKLSIFNIVDKRIKVLFTSY